MKSMYLLVTTMILWAGISFSQESDQAAPTETPEQTITVNSSAYLWESPDLVTVQITIGEYVHTDPETQATTAIELEQVKKTLFEKLKEIGVDKNDLEFLTMNEGYTPNNYNNFYGNGYQNYNTTQKKLLSASYNLEWTNKEGDLQKLYEALRFNGLTSIVLKCEYSAELREKIQKQLVQSCIDNARRNATVSMGAVNKKLGEIISINHNPTYISSNMYMGTNTLTNSLLEQKHECSAAVTYHIAD